MILPYDNKKINDYFPSVGAFQNYNKKSGNSSGCVRRVSAEESLEITALFTQSITHITCV